MQYEQAHYSPEGAVKSEPLVHRNLSDKEVQERKGMLSLQMPSRKWACAPATLEGRTALQALYMAEDAYSRLQNCRAFYHGHLSVNGHTMWVMWGAANGCPDLHQTHSWDSITNFFSRVLIDPSQTALESWYAEFLVYTRSQKTNYLLFYSRTAPPTTLYCLERIRPENSNIYPINLADPALNPVRPWMIEAAQKIVSHDDLEKAKLDWYRFMSPPNCKRAVYEFLNLLAHKVEAPDGR
jgi:hypothetical protein